MLLLARVLSYLSVVLAGIATLLLGVTFSRVERRRVPFLRRLDALRLPLFATAVVGTIMSPICQDWKDGLEEQKRDAAIRELLGPLAPRVDTVSNGTDGARDQLLAVSIIIGTEFFAKADYEGTLARYLEAYPYMKAASLTAKIGDCYFRLGDYRTSLQYASEAESQAPDWSGPPYGVALAYAQLGRLKEAMDAARRSCQLGFDGGCQLAGELSSRAPRNR